MLRRNSIHKIQYFTFVMWYLLMANTTFAYTHADTLRGSNGNGRSWWDLQHYDLSIKFDTGARSISGKNEISFTISSNAHDSMQIDLQEPMVLDRVILNEENVTVAHEGNVWWIKYPFSKWPVGSKHTITIFFHGKPRAAKLPPWDGGFVWAKDSMGRMWIAVACQELGASVWWPCKDVQWDEPDSGMKMHYCVPNGLTCVGNGRLEGKKPEGDNYTCWDWVVKNPINNYDVTFYIGNYAHWNDTLMGEKGKLSLDFYALSYNEKIARQQFAIVKPMIHCFEHWMGPYPFYEDGYKLVEAPYLGMEHQSAVAYGNKYQMGYLGRDRSNTGVGLEFDFIIVHESGHEWFGNNITAKDIADNWIHEGITTYTETLFAECLLGKKKAFEYIRGEAASNIRNDAPVIGNYGVNAEGSGDMYDKGAALVHMIRMMVNDDAKFRNMLRDMSATYYHKTVSSKEIEQYINDYTKINFTPLFDLYLRTTIIPELEYYIKGKQLYYRFTNVPNDFSLPIEVSGGSKKITIHPTNNWQNSAWKGGYNISFSKDFLIKVKS